MAHVPVRFRLNHAGKLVTEPEPPIPVGPNDTVEWTCDEGEFTVSFGEQKVFDGPQPFHGATGRPTGKMKVRADVERGRHFDCTVTLNGKVMDKVYGVDTTGG